jgi:SAM-dependent methyltransferase
LDVTLELLKTAKRRRRSKMLDERIEVLHGDIRSVPYSEGSFDFVLSEADPISICGDPEKAVSELSRVLKPNGHFVAGVDSTLYRVFKALSQGKSLDYVLDFLQIGISPAEEEADFNPKSFTPTELMSLLQKHKLRTIRIVGKPIGLSTGMLDSFVAALPAEERHRIFEDQTEKEKLRKLLCRIYEDPHVAGIGSHLQIVAVKEETGFIQSP